MRRNGIALIAVLAVAMALPALAGEGRIPLPFAGPAPYVLSMPGKYIVTRNLTTAVGPLFEVAAPDVEIDLNGMEVSSSDLGNPVIRASAGFTGLVVRNGTIFAGRVGVEVTGGSRVVVENVRSVGVAGGIEGIALSNVTNFTIRGCQLEAHTASGIRVIGAAASPVTGTIEDNTLDRIGADGITVSSGSSVTVLHNRLDNIGGTGIVIDSTSGSLIAENTVEQVTNDGIVIAGAIGPAIGNKLLDNVVRRAMQNGIRLGAGSSNAFVLNNVVTESTATGLLVGCPQNNVEGNTLNNNGNKGLWFTAAAASNVYRRNMGRGNGPGPCVGFFTGDLCDDGGGNTSPGDNFLPFLL
jgi:parallel beta-helix repeat protein